MTLNQVSGKLHPDLALLQTAYIGETQRHPVFQAGETKGSTALQGQPWGSREAARTVQRPVRSAQSLPAPGAGLVCGVLSWPQTGFTESSAGRMRAWETEATIYKPSISFSDFVPNFSTARVILPSFIFTHSFLCRLWTMTEFNTCDRESLPSLFDLFLMKALVHVSCTYLLNKQIFRQHPSAYLSWHHFERAQNYASLHMMMKVLNSPFFKTLYAALTRHLQL